MLDCPPGVVTVTSTTLAEALAGLVAEIDVVDSTDILLAGWAPKETVDP